MISEDRRILIVDSEGNEKEMEIIVTFPYNGKNFVVYFDPTADENDLNTFASIYDDDGNLYPIEDDEEWDRVEEVVNALPEEELEDEEN